MNPKPWTWLLALGLALPLVTSAAPGANAQTLAFTRFDEPDPGDRDHVANGAELGFATTFSGTGDPIHTLGVFEPAPGERTFRNRTAESVTIFDAVSLSGQTGVVVSLRTTVAATDWEAGDYFVAFVENGSGDRVFIVSLGEAQLNLAPGAPVLFYAAIPDAWTEAALVVAARTNSSSDAEILDFDEVVFARYLTPPGATWRYRDDGSDQGSAWRTPAFPDGSWASGPAQLGYGDGDEATQIEDGPDTDRFITSYFRHHFSVADPGAVPGLSGALLRDDGAIVYLNGTEVFRSNMPPDGVDFLRVASAGIDEAGEQVFHEFPVSPALLLPGDNVLAVEVHQFAPTSSDVSFDFWLLESPAPPPPALLRGPYLQVGTPSTVRIRWRTDQPTPSRVRHGNAPGSLISSSDVPGFRTEHDVEVSGLTPATRFYYSVGTPTQTLAGDDAVHWFETPPSAGTGDPVRIWVIGDSGACAINAQGCNDAAAVRDAYLGYAGAERADVWLLLGDNAYLFGTDEEYTQGLFGVYPEVMRNSVAWPIPGNHEFLLDFSDSPLQRGPYYDSFTLPTQGEAGGVPSGTEAYYSFDHANIHFLALDSHDTDRSAPADPVGGVCAPGQGGAMYQWLCMDLAATTADFTIVYWHHPPYSKGSHDSDLCPGDDVRMCEMRERFVPVLEHFGVDLQLTGHSHAYERSKLIDGHYADSSTFAPSHVVQAGDGDPNGDGAYEKPNAGLDPHRGSVYGVVGSSSILDATAQHPAMEVALSELGSMMIDVDGTRLDARFLDENGVVRDHFRIDKAVGPQIDLRINGDTSEVVVVPNLLTLTLDMASAGSTNPASWFWAFSVGGPFFWVTAGGLSVDPAPLLQAPPVDLDDLTLIQTPLPPGTVLTSVFFLFDGTELIDVDVASGVVP